MKTLLFYVLLLAPITVLALLTRLGLLTPLMFTVSLLLYAVVYHPTVIGLRLLAKHVIAKADFAKTYIPFWNMKYYGEAFS